MTTTRTAQDPKTILTNVILVMAGLTYIGGIVYLGLTPKADTVETWKSVTSAINATLAMHFGAYLGLPDKPPGQRIKDATSGDPNETLHLIAAIVYLLGLVIGAYFQVIKHNEAVGQMIQALVGVFVGVLTVRLALPPK